MKAKLINIFEKKIDDFNIDKINIDDFIDIQDQQGFLTPYVLQYMWEEYSQNIDDDNDEISEIIKTNDFKEWLHYELEIRFNNFKDDIIYTKINDNKILIYRSMIVNSNFINDMKKGNIKRIGQYWTYDIEKAEPHWGYNKSNNNNEIVFEILINEHYINWIDTFRLNLEHEFYNEEMEIRLFKNTIIIIKDILWNGSRISKEDLEQIQVFSYKA